MHLTVRPIARLAMPSAASSTIRARCRSRYSVLLERAKPSSSARSSVVRSDRSRFRDAAHASLNHDLFISDSGYQGGFR